MVQNEARMRQGRKHFLTTGNKTQQIFPHSPPSLNRYLRDEIVNRQKVVRIIKLSLVSMHKSMCVVYRLSFTSMFRRY